MEAPDFWDNPEKSQESMKNLKSMKDDIAIYAKLKDEFDEIETLIEMAAEENDESLIPEIQDLLDDFRKTYDDIRIKTLLSGEYDKDNAIVTLHAGAGGTESCDWAGMLYRMYTRWADKHGFAVDVLDYLDGDEAGLKSASILMAMRRASSPLPSRLTEKMPTAISNPKRVSTDWSVSHRSMRLERDRPRLYPAMSCRILRKTSISRSGMKICVSILTVPAEPAVSISTRPPRRSVSPICRPTSLFSARMSVPST